MIYSLGLLKSYKLLAASFKQAPILQNYAQQTYCKIVFKFEKLTINTFAVDINCTNF